MLGIKRIQSNLALLKKIQVSRPENAKGRWKGTSHHDLIEEFKAQVAEREWRIAQPKFHIERSGADMVFSCILLTGDLPTIPIGSQHTHSNDFLYPAIGLAVSNARRRRLTFYSGLTRQGELGSVVLSRWHGSLYTHYFEPVGTVERALEAWTLAQHSHRETVDRLRGVRLGLDESENLLLQAAHDRIMPWSRIPRVISVCSGRKNFRDGSIQVQPIDLLLAFSEVCNMNPPSKQMDQQFTFARSVSLYIDEPESAAV